jgi:hypothetical protein
MEKRFSDLVSRVEGEVDAFRKEEERRRIEEERRRLEEERKRLEEERRKAEEERKRKEEEARRRAEEARRKAEEERRKAEEERERLREIERRRLEEERYRNRFLGTYYWEGHGGMLKIRIRFTSPSSANCLYVCTVCGEHHIRYRVDTDGNAITLASKSRSGDNCTWSDYQLVGHFTGGINSAGTQISGYWFNYINKGETVTLVKI